MNEIAKTMISELRGGKSSKDVQYLATTMKEALETKLKEALETKQNATGGDVE